MSLYAGTRNGPTRLDAEELVGLASKLRDVERRGWGEPALRALVAQLDWSWRDGAEGPVFGTGLRTGYASTKYISRSPVAGQPDGYHGLYIPVVISEESVAAKVADFRWAAGVLSSAFGESAILGAYGREMPFDSNSASWGNPFRRWVLGGDYLELRGTEAGAELILYNTGMVESWQYARALSLAGFFGSRPVPESAGMLCIPAKGNDDWESFQGALDRFLTPLAAELSALDVETRLAIVGCHPEVAGAAIDVELSEGRLRLGVAADVDGYGEIHPAEFVRLAAAYLELGWNPVGDPSDFSLANNAFFSSDGYEPGEVNGKRLARLIVGTFQVVGVPSVHRPYLYLGDWSWMIDDLTDGYQTEWYGLNLSGWH